MGRILKTGVGWRLGWDAEATDFQGLVGTDDWSFELTEAELNDFCRLLGQLAAAIAQISAELMAEETLVCEVESPLVWLEAEGDSQSYSLHLILLTGRRSEGHWGAAAVPELLQAARSLQVF